LRTSLETTLKSGWGVGIFAGNAIAEKLFSRNRKRARQRRLDLRQALIHRKSVPAVNRIGSW
jgi:hypothetical protein